MVTRIFGLVRGGWNDYFVHILLMGNEEIHGHFGLYFYFFHCARSKNVGETAVFPEHGLPGWMHLSAWAAGWLGIVVFFLNNNNNIYLFLCRILNISKRTKPTNSISQK